jgi:1-acyl-sn-glycerol-3-phosphate acyltransferase
VGELIDPAVMAESVRAADTRPLAEPVDDRGVRVALSPYLFRGMLVSMAAVAIALHRTTGSRSLAWAFAKARARDLEWMLGVRTTLHGLEHVADGGSYVYAPNHQSHLDILALLGHLPGPTRFAAKRELWRHPVVGGVLDTLGMIPIDREAGAESKAELDRAAAEGSSIVIFPEGTRSRDGRLREFKKGAFVLAIATGLPIVPVCCIGTRRLMPRGSRLMVVPGDVDVFIEPPIPTAGLRYEDRDDLAARVREAIARRHTGW